MTPAAVVPKLWNYCNVLRDEGMSCGDCVEQLTYLLFLKPVNSRRSPPYNQPSAVPAKYNWPTLLKKDGDDLLDHCRHMLESLGKDFSRFVWLRIYQVSFVAVQRTSSVQVYTV